MQEYVNGIPRLVIQGSEKDISNNFLQILVEHFKKRGLEPVLYNHLESSTERNQGVDQVSADFLITQVDYPVPNLPCITLQDSDDEKLTFSSHFPGRGEPFDRIFSWLEGEWQREKLMGCVLIGGKSSRMGRPKHLLPLSDGRVWLEKQVSIFHEKGGDVVLSGKGEIPASLHHLVRIEDVEGGGGPMAGILAVMRKHPGVSFIFAACDMPDLHPDAIEWLKQKRGPGIWGIVPQNEKTGKYEPLMAYYNHRCLRLIERLYEQGNNRLRDISTSPKIYHPLLDNEVRNYWRNCNRPEDLSAKESKNSLANKKE